MVNRDEVFKRIESVADMVWRGDIDITESQTLYDAGFDSLDIVELVMGTEEEFGVVISDEEADKFETFKDIVDWVVEEMT
jgi:acyl carrier protein